MISALFSFKSDIALRAADALAPALFAAFLAPIPFTSAPPTVPATAAVTAAILNLFYYFM
jgi:hypothetical protein